MIAVGEVPAPAPPADESVLRGLLAGGEVSAAVWVLIVLMEFGPPEVTVWPNKSDCDRWLDGMLAVQAAKIPGAQEIIVGGCLEAKYVTEGLPK